jgi:hypothetical protein
VGWGVSGTGVVDVTFFTMRAGAMAADQQGGVGAAAAETDPHEQQVDEEEDVGKQDETP